jgi:predicted esterase
MVMDPTRRRLLIGGAAAVGVAGAGAAAWPFLPNRLKNVFVDPPPPFVPDAAEGQVTLETVYSQERGTEVELFTAVPAGYGDGAGLPVVVICHGATATPADYGPYGLARFLTAAVEAGTKPFVLAGAAGGVLQWEPQESGDDPQGMVLDEVPVWLDDRGFDGSRRALWGWSMGGYGVLRMAQVDPGWARAIAAFSPAISSGDAVFSAVDRLRDQPLGLWCGTDDPFYDAVRELVAVLPTRPEILTYGPGGHGRLYWNAHILDAFAFLSSHLGSVR